MASARTTSPIDAYLANVADPAQRAALQRLRAQIQAADPHAIEAVSYRMPAFKHDGRIVACFAAFRGHCSYFPASGSVFRHHEAELAGRIFGKGTVRFTPDDPLPASLVRKMVRTRLREIQDQVDAKAAKHVAAKAGKAAKKRRPPMA